MLVFLLRCLRISGAVGREVLLGLGSEGSFVGKLEWITLPGKGGTGTVTGRGGTSVTGAAGGGLSSGAEEF